MELLKLAIEKFAWPVVVLILGVAWAFIFKKPVGALLGRTTKLGKDGLEAANSTATQLQAPAVDEKEAVDALAKQATKNIESYGIPTVIFEREQAITGQLASLHLEDKKAIEILTRQLAVVQQIVFDESTYRLIFGSQIELLKRLNLYGPIAFGDVEAHFDAIKTQHEVFFESYGIEKYIGFMRGRFLVQDADGRLEITALGRHFLEWMVQAQVYELSKAG